MFEISQTIDLIWRKLKAWSKLPVLIGPYQIVNHVHAMKVMEGYLDYIWLPSTIWCHDPMGLITAHFKVLSLTITYKHETCPDDFPFEDVKGFEDVIVKMHLKKILEDKIGTLVEDP